MSYLLLEPDPKDRINLYPIKYLDIWKFRKDIEKSRWVAEEVRFDKDSMQYIQLSPTKQKLISWQLAFFSGFDNIINDNITINLEKAFDVREIESVYIAQKEQELVHVESYNIQIETLIGTQAERNAIMSSITENPIIKKMAQWFESYNNNAISALIASAFVEGVMFQASFAILQWFREERILDGVTHANELISRDEGLHTEFSCYLINHYVNKNSSDINIDKMADEVVNLMDTFIDEILPPNVEISITADDMKKFIRSRCHNVVTMMGKKSKYSSEHPFKFMDQLTMNNTQKTNFFEHRSSAYGGITAESLNFSIDASLI